MSGDKVYRDKPDPREDVCHVQPENDWPRSNTVPELLLVDELLTQLRQHALDAGEKSARQTLEIAELREQLKMATARTTNLAATRRIVDQIDALHGQGWAAQFARQCHNVMGREDHD